MGGTAEAGRRHGLARAHQRAVCARPRAGTPDRAQRLPSRNASPVEQCKAVCVKRMRGAGCAAFSVSVAPHPTNPARAPTRVCNVFDAAVPHRTCAAGDAAGLCGQKSEGSFRVRYA